MIFERIRRKILYITCRLRTIILFRNNKNIGKGVSFGKGGWFYGLRYVKIGDNSSFGDFQVITAWDNYRSADGMQGFNPTIQIGANCSFGSWNHYIIYKSDRNRRMAFNRKMGYNNRSFTWDDKHDRFNKASNRAALILKRSNSDRK